MGITLHCDVLNSLDLVVRDKHPAQRDPIPQEKGLTPCKELTIYVLVIGPESDHCLPLSLTD